MFRFDKMSEEFCRIKCLKIDVLKLFIQYVSSLWRAYFPKIYIIRQSVSLYCVYTVVKTLSDNREPIKCLLHGLSGTGQAEWLGNRQIAPSSVFSADAVWFYTLFL